MNSRKLAFKILEKCFSEKTSSLKTVAEKEFSFQSLPVKDKAFALELSYGVMRWLYALDTLLLLEENKINRKVLNVLRLGLYQIIFLKNHPAHAIIYETVEITPVKQLKGFVNAVLRKLLIKYKEHPADIILEKFQDDVKYAVPPNISEILKKDFSLPVVNKIFSKINQPPKLAINVNFLKTDRPILMEKFSSKAISVSLTQISDAGLVSGIGPEQLISLTEFREGHFFFQGEFSQLFPQLLKGLKPEKILDCFSGKGGKALSLGVRFPAATIHGIESNKKQLLKFKENIQRLSLQNLTLYYEDVFCFNGDKNFYDLIIVDPPCSSFGAIYKHPEIKYFFSVEQLNELIKLQETGLEKISGFLKPGGLLFYSVCTFLKAETTERIYSFLGNNENYSLEPFTQKEIPEDLLHEGFFLSVPGISSREGFFIARLRKRQTGLLR